MDNLNDDYEKNAIVGEEVEIAKGVTVSWIFVGRRPCIQPILLIQEDTRIKDIEKNWWSITKYSRDVVWKSTGSYLQPNNLEIVYDLYLKYKKGIKPAELAKRLNYDFLAVVHTVFFKEGVSKPDSADLSYFAMKWIIDDLKIGWNETDYEKYLSRHNVDIKMGFYTFDLNSYPIESVRISSRIKTLRTGIDKGRVFRPEERPGSQIDILEAFLLIEGSYEKTNKTIQKIDNPYWQTHKKWINHRLETISDMVENSTNKLIIAMKQRN